MTLPAVDTIQTYGGALNNFGLGVVDPTTDRDAAQANKAYANVAMMTHTLPRCWARFTTSATTPTLVSHDAAWGNGGNVAPGVGRIGTGHFILTWPTTVQDELGVVSTLNLRTGALGEIGGIAAAHVQVTRFSANQLVVRCFTTAGTADDIAGTTVSVFGY